MVVIVRKGGGGVRVCRDGLESGISIGSDRAHGSGQLFLFLSVKELCVILENNAVSGIRIFPQGGLLRFGVYSKRKKETGGQQEKSAYHNHRTEGAPAGAFLSFISHSHHLRVSETGGASWWQEYYISE